MRDNRKLIPRPNACNQQRQSPQRQGLHSQCLMYSISNLLSYTPPGYNAVPVAPARVPVISDTPKRPASLTLRLDGRNASFDRGLGHPEPDAACQKRPARPELMRYPANPNEAGQN
jgi:hypothetical protein